MEEHLTPKSDVNPSETFPPKAVEMDLELPIRSWEGAQASSEVDNNDSVVEEALEALDMVASSQEHDDNAEQCPDPSMVEDATSSSLSQQSEGDDSIDPWSTFRINLPSLERWGISSPAGLILFKAEILWRESSSHAATVLLLGLPVILGGILWALGHGLEWVVLLIIRPGGHQRSQLRRWCSEEWGTLIARWRYVRRASGSLMGGVGRAFHRRMGWRRNARLNATIDLG